MSGTELKDRIDSFQQQINALLSRVHTLEEESDLSGPVPEDKGTQFVLSVTLDEVKIRWRSKAGATADKIAELVGEAAANELGFTKVKHKSFSDPEYFMTWGRP